MTTLSHLFAHVSDLDRARRFYVEELGLSILMQEEGYLRVGGGDGFHMGMEQRDPSQVGSAGIEIVIRVPDVDAAYQDLVDRGHRFEAPPADMPWGARHAWLTDPDGYRLSIYSRGCAGAASRATATGIADRGVRLAAAVAVASRR